MQQIACSITDIDSARQVQDVVHSECHQTVETVEGKVAIKHLQLLTYCTKNTDKGRVHKPLYEGPMVPS